MAGYEAFIFDPQEEEDEKITLLSEYSGPSEVQEVEAELGKLSLGLREHISKFVTNRGDFKTYVHRLVYLSKVDANRYSFIVKYFPSPALSMLDLERLYCAWVATEHGISLPEPALPGVLVLLSKPYTLSALQRWIGTCYEEGTGAG